MAVKHLKSNTLDISTKLPPTSNSFYQHCLRCWRQTYTWKKAFEQYDIICHYPVEDYGYQLTDNGAISLQWITIPPMPDDISLVKCGNCTSGCRKCKCNVYNLSCTPFCGCSPENCKNRTNTQVSTPTTLTAPLPSKNGKYVKKKYYICDDEHDIHRNSNTDIDFEDQDIIESDYDDLSLNNCIFSEYGDDTNNNNTQNNAFDTSIFDEDSYSFEFRSASQDLNTQDLQLNSKCAKRKYSTVGFDEIVSPQYVSSQ
ncbi:unnamed protein product, partial [Rotaria sp. Silwood1]